MIASHQLECFDAVACERHTMAAGRQMALKQPRVRGDVIDHENRADGRPKNCGLPEPLCQLHDVRGMTVKNV